MYIHTQIELVTRPERAQSVGKKPEVKYVVAKKASEAGWPQGHVQAGRPQDEKGQYGKEGQSYD